MRWRLACGPLVCAAAVWAACGGSNALSPSSNGRAPIPLTVMTFNIQHGIDGTSRYNLQRAIDVIARVNPDVVGLQEVTRNHPYYNCDDQPALIAAGVSAATGVQWRAAYQQEWFTPDVSCQAQGRGDGNETEGLVLLSRHALGATATVKLPDTRIGFEAPVRDAYDLPVIVTHLTSGAGGAAMRATQAAQLRDWAAAFGQPQVLMGDLNSTSGAPELQPLFGAYHDAWTDAARAGRAIGSGISHGTSTIDFILYQPGTSLTVQSVQVVDTAALVGVEASDHRPVVATITVR